MKSGIYKILNITTGKIYIGSAVNIASRWRRHIHDLNKGKHQNIHLQRAWAKHTEDAFDFIILELCEKDKLIEREQYWLNWLKPFDLNIGYNLSPTAGNSLGVKHSEETRKRMSEAKRKMTPETKKLMSDIRKSKKLTEQHKANIAAGIKGRVLSEETKAKISAAHKGKVLSEETKKKISAGNKNLGTKRGKYKPRALILNAQPIGY